MSCVGGTRGVQERSVGFSGGRYLELWVLEFQSWHLPANSREKQGALWVRTLLRDDNRSEGYYSFMKLLHPQVLHSHGPNEALSLLTSLPTLSNCSSEERCSTFRTWNSMWGGGQAPWVFPRNQRFLSHEF